jgi:hypothetical protein
MPMAAIKLLCENLHRISVAFGLIAFVGYWVKDIRASRKPSLEELITRVFAASAIPTAVVLLTCAVEPKIIQSLQGLNIYIAAAALVLLFVSWSNLTKMEP